MTTWDYGEAGTAYPVKMGETWRIGKHLFICSDLMESGKLDETLFVDPPTLLYCDPPWGQALVNGFRTKAGLEKADYRWEELYHRIAEVGHSRAIPVWVEGSRLESKDGQVIPLTIQPRASVNYPAYFPTTYYGNKPAGLYYAGSVPHPPVLDEVLSGADDENTPGIVMSAYPPGRVVDPCAGMGGTARHAELQGWYSVNNELNSHRMSGALHSLMLMTGERPERL